MYVHGFLPSLLSTLMVSPDAAALVGFSFPSSLQAVIPVTQSSATPTFNDRGLLLSDKHPTQQGSIILTPDPGSPKTLWHQSSDPDEHSQGPSRAYDTIFSLLCAHCCFYFSAQSAAAQLGAWQSSYKYQHSCTQSLHEEPFIHTMWATQMKQAKTSPRYRICK